MNLLNHQLNRKAQELNSCAFYVILIKRMRLYLIDSGLMIYYLFLIYVLKLSFLSNIAEHEYKQSSQDNEIAYRYFLNSLKLITELIYKKNYILAPLIKMMQK